MTTKQPGVEDKPILRHMTQLDGLRALAVLSVFVSHFGPPANPMVSNVPWGAMGVRLFFVLSGFLITGILLKCRQQRDDGQGSSGPLLGKFYARRFLRIFPVYYAALIIFAVMNIRPVRSFFWWHLTYTSNIGYAWQGNFGGPGSHFWSLAVEEQFYLVWPWLIFFAPKRALLPLNIAVVALAVGFRSVGAALGWNALALQILPFGCLDALGLGSLLALLTAGGTNWSATVGRFVQISFWSGLLLSVFLVVAGLEAWGGQLEVALQVFAMALVFVAIVAWGARGMTGTAGKFLSWGPLVYIGKISYGMYVYHAFISVIGPRVFDFLGLHALFEHFDGVLNTLLTILLAAVSWHFFEAPINRLKKWFNYADAPVQAPGGDVMPANGVVQTQI